jgi:hypothetical protein
VPTESGVLLVEEYYKEIQIRYPEVVFLNRYLEIELLADHASLVVNPIIQDFTDLHIRRHLFFSRYSKEIKRFTRLTENDGYIIKWLNPYVIVILEKNSEAAHTIRVELQWPLLKKNEQLFRRMSEITLKPVLEAKLTETLAAYE